MLYDFHHKQNTKKPGTVHATYLLTGIRRVPTSSQTNGVHSQDDEDIPMQSSPPLPSSSAAEPHDSTPGSSIIRSILLVKEEHLAQAKSTFDSISSIHIYSLECNGLSDMQTLTECNRQIDANYASEDPLQAWKQYGTIQNANVKRRTGRGAAPPPPPAPIEKNAQAKLAPSATTAKAKEAEMKAEVKPAAPPPEKKGSSTTSFPKPVQAKRENSDIFKSFSKAKPPAAASPVPADPDPKGDDDLMTGFSDDEGVDDEELEKEVGEAAKTLLPAGKSKKEREAELQAMMEQEDDVDEAMEDVAATTPDAAAVEAPSKVEEEAEEPKETVTIENGRRRGKRRIMKKKTVKDEDGYLGKTCSSPFSVLERSSPLTIRRQ